MERVSGSTVSAAVILLLLSSMTTGQEKSVRSQAEDSSIHVITIDPESQAAVSGKEAKELRQRLKQAPDVPIQIVGDGAPVTISEAIVRGVQREEQAAVAGSAAPSMINDYAMSIRVTLLNEADKPVTGVRLQLTNTEAGHTFYVYRNHIFMGRKKAHGIDIEFMTVSGDPSRLTVRVVGVVLEDNRVWGSYPFPRPQMDSSPAASKDEVDEKPKLLNRPMPLYALQARENGVQGVVRVKIELGADGSIGRIQVINALPDGLTESAIKAVREMRFKPAKKGGVAVSHWQKIDIEFNLK